VDDIDKIAAQIEQHVKDTFPEGVSVPAPDEASEDEAVSAVQEQFAEAGFECPDAEARRIVRHAWEQAEQGGEDH
jgi:hypothetical protein